ncbi:MAG TPA: hypothetical protein VMG41_03470 [Gemmatimonadales bacterium]|nr:hypothetical protein [Gemmatimonadales bacterium]
MSARSAAVSQGGRLLVGVDALHAGMVLAENVHDAQGRLLIPEGTELTDRHLRAFQLWGIPGVRVRQSDFEQTPVRAPSPECLRQAEAAVRARFGAADLSHPMLSELFRICVQREATRLANLEGSRG